MGPLAHGPQAIALADAAVAAGSKPRPSSTTSTCACAPASEKITCAQRAPACLRTLESASWMMRINCTSVRLGSPRSASSGGTTSSTGRPYCRMKRRKYCSNVRKEGMVSRNHALKSHQVLAHVDLGLKGRLAQVGQLLVYSLRFPLVEQQPGRARLQMGRRQGLPQAIVELAAQSDTFLNTGQRALLFEDLRLSPSLRGHITQDQQTADQGSADVLERGKSRCIKRAAAPAPTVISGSSPISAPGPTAVSGSMAGTCPEGSSACHGACHGRRLSGRPASLRRPDSG